MGIPAADHVAGLLGATRFLPAIEAATPDLLEEVRGIAEGAAVSFERILAFNLMDEEWWYSQARGHRHACSLVAIAAGEGRGALLAQNMDLPEVMDGGQAVLRSTTPDGGQTVVLTAAGMIGLTGCSSDGLGVCVNTLSMLNHSPDRAPGRVRAARVARAPLAGRGRGVPARRPARVGPALRDRERRRRRRLRVLGGRRRRIRRRAGPVLAHEPPAREPRPRPGRRRSGGNGRLTAPARPARRDGPRHRVDRRLRAAPGRQARAPLRGPRGRAPLAHVRVDRDGALVAARRCGSRRARPTAHPGSTPRRRPSAQPPRKPSRTRTIARHRYHGV